MQPLIITLEFARALKAEDPYEFVFAPQEYRLRRPGGGIETASLAWNQALREDLAALRAPRRDPLLPQRIGELLRSFVTPLGWEEYAGQILEAVRQGRRVLLSIRSAAAELYSLPWELLTIKATGQHVGELPGVLLRYEWPETTTSPEQPLPRQGHGRILLAWSAASGAVPAVEHQRAIESACQAGGITFNAARDVLSQVSMGRLQAVLAEAKKSNQPISVLHLLAHGGARGNTFGLVLDGESTADDSVIVDAGQLRRLLAPYADMVRLVVLSACDSANAGALGNALGSVAQTLHRAGMAAVVASRYPLSVVGSMRLAEALYRGLAVGPDSLESALLAARDGLAKDAAQNDWSSLQLYARAADGEDTRPLRFRPYIGLASFGVSDQRFFHGREAVTQSLRQRFGALSQTPDALRLLAVLGPSGSGKSSVARAGLLASLLRAPWPGPPPIRLAVLRPGERPIDSLAKSLLPLRAADAQSDLTTLLRDPAAEGLSRLASSLPEIQTSPLVVFVDQFEELYTLCKDDAERDAFVGLLMHAAQDPSRQVAVVLTLRTDFFGETQQRHPELNRVIGAQHELVTAMSPAELAVAIAKPAEQAGRPMDEAIVELLLSEVRGKAGALPLLAFALSRIWEGMERGEEPSATLQQIGGVGGALAGEAQKIYQSLSVSEQATARRALSRMVRLGEGTKDTRRLAPISELCGRGETEASVLSVLRQFATENVRLVTLSGEGNETRAEFTHEALFEHWAELRTWINQSRSDRGLLDRALAAAKLWIKDGRPSGRLWRSPDLDLLREYQRRKPEDFGPLAEEFLAAAERRRKTEWALRLGAVAAIVSALLIAAGVYLVKQQELTQKERQRTLEASAAKEAVRQQLLDAYVERGRQLALESGQPSEGLLWLHRAQEEGSKNPALPDLLMGVLSSAGMPKAVLIGHAGRVMGAAYSPDGRRIATGSADKTARVWDADSGQLIAELKGHGDSVYSLTYSPDGRRIVTASADKTARVWDADSGQLVAELKGHGDSVVSATYRPDGRRIVTASADQTARVWDADSGQLVAELKGHGDGVVSATYRPDGRRIVTASADQTARVWDADSGRLVAELTGHGRSVESATYSPDGLRIVTTSDDKTARLWEADSGRLVAELKGHRSGVYRATYRPDGRRIVTASADQTARVWDADSGQLVAELKGHGRSVESATYSPDGRHIVTASADQTARVWDADSGRLVVELQGHGNRIASATYRPDGRRIVTGSDDKTARVWEADSGRLIADLRGHGAWVRSAAYSPDGRRIVTASEDDTARVWEADSNRLVAELKGHSDIIYSASYSPDARRIVTASDDQTARVWDADSGRLVAELKGHGSSVYSATYRPDARHIVTASADQTARVWDADSGRLVAELKGHGDRVYSATYRPDGRRIVTASGDGTARVWDADSGRLVAELGGHGAWVRSATFSPDGRRIVTASGNGTARVWDADSGRLVAELKGHGDSVFRATFSPDGRRIVTASYDHTARVWEADSGRLVAELKGHGDSLYGAAYSPDGHRIVTASDDKTARLWEADSGRLIAELKGHGDSVYSATFNPDGRRVVTVSNDHTARVWDLSPETRTPDQLAAFIRCHLPIQLDAANKNVLVPHTPTREDCPAAAPPPRAQGGK